MFLTVVIVIWIIFGFIKPYLINYIDEFTDSESSQIKTTVSVFFAFLDVGISAVITSYVESIFAAKQDFPRIFITSPKKNTRNVSGIKTTHSCPQHLCIKIGDSQPKFRIVYAKIKNTGRSIMSECIINKQVLNIVLDPDQNSELYFIVHESVNGTQSNNNYKFSYCIRDDQGNTYTGKYCMQVDNSKSIATFRAFKKMKRSVLKNALSNL